MANRTKANTTRQRTPQKFIPNKTTVRCTKKFLEKYTLEGIPSWVLEFDGPLKKYGLKKTCEILLSDSFGLLWQRWADTMMESGLGSMVVPMIYYESGQPIIKFCLFLSRTEEALRMGSTHVSKDSELSPLPTQHVVNVSDVQVWKTQRRHMADAFLPLGPLSKAVPTLMLMSNQMITNWKVALSKAKEERSEDNEEDDHQSLDVREWMHHTALGMFVACMMGDDHAFSPALENPLALDVDLYSDYDDDVAFQGTEKRTNFFFFFFFFFFLFFPFFFLSFYLSIFLSSFLLNPLLGMW